MGESTGSFKAWIANGGKRSVGKVTGISAASVGTVLAILHMFPNAVPGYADAQAAKQKMDTVVASATKIDSMEKRIDRLEDKQDQGNVWLMQLLTAQGVQPIMLAPKDTTNADTSKTRPR